MTGRVPTPGAASGSAARPAVESPARWSAARRRSAALGRPAGPPRTGSVARRRSAALGTTARPARTGSGRPTTGIGPRAPACRPVRATGTAIDTRAARRARPATRAARAGPTGRPRADRRARRPAPGPPASRWRDRGRAPARARIDDRGSRGPPADRHSRPPVPEADLGPRRRGADRRAAARRGGVRRGAARPPPARRAAAPAGARTARPPRDEPADPGRRGRGRDAHLDRRLRRPPGHRPRRGAADAMPASTTSSPGRSSAASRRSSSSSTRSRIPRTSGRCSGARRRPASTASIFPTHHQAPLTPAAVKASAGAVEHLLLAPVDDLPGALSDLRIRGLRIAGRRGRRAADGRRGRPPRARWRSSSAARARAFRRPSGAGRDLAVRIPMRGSIALAQRGRRRLDPAVRRGRPATGARRGRRPPRPSPTEPSAAADEPSRPAESTTADAPPPRRHPGRKRRAAEPATTTVERRRRARGRAAVAAATAKPRPKATAKAARSRRPRRRRRPPRRPRPRPRRPREAHGEDRRPRPTRPPQGRGEGPGQGADGRLEAEGDAREGRSKATRKPVATDADEPIRRRSAAGRSGPLETRSPRRLTVPTAGPYHSPAPKGPSAVWPCARRRSSIGRAAVL